MEAAELESWLWASRTSASKTHGLGDHWWPNSTKAGDKTSAWALAFFLAAAEDRCFGKLLTLSSNADEVTQPIIDGWKALPGRDHSSHEVLVDYSMHNWDAASPIQMTCESEAWPYYTTGDSLEGYDDYSWDFYKLLVVPSASRLFFARVGGKTKLPDKGSTTERIGRLLGTLQSLVDLYGPAMLRPNDELGGAIVPYSPKDLDSAVVFWLDRGRLRSTAVTQHPPVGGAAVVDAGTDEPEG